MKVLTVGGAMVDTIAVIESERIERMTMRNAETSFLLLEEGRKTDALDISTHCGGGAVNAAVSMARLGHDVACLVKLGKDDRADMILSRLESEGVSTRWSMRDGGAPTGASVLVAAHDRNAAVFTFRGANTLLVCEDLKREAFAVDLVYVASLSNKSAECFPAIIEQAKAAGAMVATNPGIRQLSARQSELQHSLKRTDLLAVNRTEADTLVPSLVSRYGEGGPKLKADGSTEPPALAQRGFESGGFHMSMPAYLDAVHDLGCKWIVVTDGRHGAYLGAPEGVYHCPVLPDVVVTSTVGAGDAFTSTLASLLAAGETPEDALLGATVNAAAVISKLDTQTGLLRAPELQAGRERARKSMRVRFWPR